MVVLLVQQKLWATQILPVCGTYCVLPVPVDSDWQNTQNQGVKTWVLVPFQDRADENRTCFPSLLLQQPVACKHVSYFDFSAVLPIIIAICLSVLERTGPHQSLATGAWPVKGQSWDFVGLSWGLMYRLKPSLIKKKRLGWVSIHPKFCLMLCSFRNWISFVMIEYHFGQSW